MGNSETPVGEGRHFARPPSSGRAWTPVPAGRGAAGKASVGRFLKGRWGGPATRAHSGPYKKAAIRGPGMCGGPDGGRLRVGVGGQPPPAPGCPTGQPDQRQQILPASGSQHRALAGTSASRPGRGLPGPHPASLLRVGGSSSAGGRSYALGAAGGPWPLPYRHEQYAQGVRSGHTPGHTPGYMLGTHAWGTR